MRNRPTTLEDSSLSTASRGEPAAARHFDWQRLAPSKHAVAFAVVYVVWGSTYLAIRVGVESIPPFILAGTRSLIAGLVLFAWARARGAPKANGRDWWRAGVAGVLMLAGGNGLVTWAETRVSSSLAALLIAAVPSHVALLDWLRPGGKRPSRKVLVGVGVGMVGMILLVRPAPGVIAQSHWEGVAAVGIAGLCWALGSLYSRYSPMHTDRTVSAAHQMLVGGAVLLGLAVARGEASAFELASVSAASLWALGYLTLFGSLLAFSAFNWLVGATTPARLSTTAYVNPLVAVLLGWALLDEALHPVSLGGAVLILCAVALMVTGQAPTRSSPNPLPPRPR